MPSHTVPEPIPKLGGRHSVTVFWRHKPELYRLVGSACAKCGKKYFPRKPICPRCHSRNLKEFELPRSGKIFSVQMGTGTLMGFEDMRPQVYGIIHFEKDDVYVQGEIIDIPYDFLRSELLSPRGEIVRRLMGKSVNVVFRRLRRLDNGYPVYGFKFALADGWSG